MANEIGDQAMGARVGVPVVGSTTAVASGPLSADELERIDAYWRAANYLSVGQIYLLDNPLLREPLQPEHVKPRLLGHWGTTPGPELHLRPPEPRHPRRATSTRSTSPAPATAARRIVANTYLEGTYSEVYPSITQDARGHARGCSGSSPSPAASPATSRPRRRARSTRAASSATRSRTPTARPSTTPTCVVACVVGDGEAETGPLADELALEQVPRTRSRDGAVLPILHLNGYKIANPTVLARIPRATSCARLLRGYGYQPLLRRGRRPGDGAPAHGRRRSTRSSTRSARSSARARERRRRRSARAGR